MTMLGKSEGRKRVHKVLARAGYGKGGALQAADGAGPPKLGSYLAHIESETHAEGNSPKKRMDRKTRSAGGRSGIHIKPSHTGLLTKEVGKKGLRVGNLRKEIAHDKSEGNTAKEKREVFALNAKTKFKHSALVTPAC